MGLIYFILLFGTLACSVLSHLRALILTAWAIPWRGSIAYDSFRD